MSEYPAAPSISEAAEELGGAAIAALMAKLQAQEDLIRTQAAMLEHSRKIFARSSEAARIGVWECNLADHALTWTDMVYDIFEFPRGSVLDRDRTVACYTPASARELAVRRSKAIEDRTGFSLDAEIITANGNRRWMRITATVECENGEPVRIFGMKQDITQEKILADRTRYLAEFDEMTGLANRSQFQAVLSNMAARAAEERALGALLLVDLDGFKIVNDTYGHAAGDECLRETAERLRSVSGAAELVARIGGDEFALLLGAEHDLAVAAELARAIIDAVSQPVKRFGTTLQLGASVGIALFEPGATAHLFTRADSALYAAKAGGRNTFRIFKTGHGVCAKDAAA